MQSMLFCHDLQIRTSNHSSAILAARFLFRSFPYCYASAFRRHRHYVFGLSVRPSVRPSARSPNNPLSTCTLVHWSVRPTVTVFQPVRPSVRLGFGHFLGNAWRITLKICMLMYPDQLQSWLDFDRAMLLLLIMMLLCFSEMVIFGVSGYALSGECLGVNVERRHISDALRRVLSSSLMKHISAIVSSSWNKNKLLTWFWPGMAFPMNNSAGYF